MAVNTSPVIPRLVEVYQEMIGFRREFCADHHFFRMPSYWDWLCSGPGNWKVKPYRSSEAEDFKRQAAVVVFQDNVTLIADEKLLVLARQGCKLSNFILAHEVAHLALNHHAHGKVVKHFKLFSGPDGNSNIPPTVEEAEANYAATFLQCGTALMDKRWETLQLAHRAFTDVNAIRKARKLLQTDAFQKELIRVKPSNPRVVL
jgi:hypothetical protein